MAWAPSNGEKRIMQSQQEQYRNYAAAQAAYAASTAPSTPAGPNRLPPVPPGGYDHPLGPLVRTGQGGYARGFDPYNQYDGRGNVVRTMSEGLTPEQNARNLASLQALNPPTLNMSAYAPAQSSFVPGNTQTQIQSPFGNFDNQAAFDNQRNAFVGQFLQNQSQFNQNQMAGTPTPRMSLQDINTQAAGNIANGTFQGNPLQSGSLAGLAGLFQQYGMQMPGNDFLSQLTGMLGSQSAPSLYQPPGNLAGINNAPRPGMPTNDGGYSGVIAPGAPMPPPDLSNDPGYQQWRQGISITTDYLGPEGEAARERDLQAQYLRERGGSGSAEPWWRAHRGPGDGPDDRPYAERQINPGIGPGADLRPINPATGNVPARGPFPNPEYPYTQPGGPRYRAPGPPVPEPPRYGVIRTDPRRPGQELYRPAPQFGAPAEEPYWRITAEARARAEREAEDTRRRAAEYRRDNPRPVQGVPSAPMAGTPTPQAPRTTGSAAPLAPRVQARPARPPQNLQGFNNWVRSKRR